MKFITSLKIIKDDTNTFSYNNSINRNNIYGFTVEALFCKISCRNCSLLHCLYICRFFFEGEYNRFNCTGSIGDILHHNASLVKTHIPDYWPLYCLITDIICGVYFFIVFRTKTTKN